MQSKESKYSTIKYDSYLGLDKVLSAQETRSKNVDNNEAHEEMLFIIIHQVYELWFKQIIHELESVLDMFKRGQVDERHIGTAVSRLRRVSEIQELLIAQIRVLETMTPLDFLDFRAYLFPASGFESFQFRKLENILGLPESARITYNGCPYFHVFEEARQKELQKADKEDSLFLAIEDWLERTPFVQTDKFQFLSSYQTAVDKMLSKEMKAINQSPNLSHHEKARRLDMLGSTDTYFKTVLDRTTYQKQKEDGKIRLSYKATIAALFINLYRDEPLLQLPYQLLISLVDIDENLTTWRYRHAQMVQRMLGNKIGTGGSSGYEYLHSTAVKHTIYRDLHNISTLLIPRSELPELPSQIKQMLSFSYQSK